MTQPSFLPRRLTEWRCQAPAYRAITLRADSVILTRWQGASREDAEYATLHMAELAIESGEIAWQPLGTKTAGRVSPLGNRASK